MDDTTLSDLIDWDHVSTLPEGRIAEITSDLDSMCRAAGVDPCEGSAATEGSDDEGQ